MKTNTENVFCFCRWDARFDSEGHLRAHYKRMHTVILDVVVAVHQMAYPAEMREIDKFITDHECRRYGIDIAQFKLMLLQITKLKRQLPKHIDAV